MNLPVYLPSTRSVRDAFDEEIGALGGHVADVFDDGARLIARAVLAVDADVQPSDRIRAGVAVHVEGTEISVHPYTLREVCTNGAVAARAFESRSIERFDAVDELPSYEGAVAEHHLRDAIRACAAPEAFATAVNDMRSALRINAEMALQMLPMLARLPQHLMGQYLPEVFRRFAADTDRSAFGLINAVTSTARDSRDPDTRWRLEVVGGSLPALLRARSPVAPESAVAVPG
jgi:hypothetical protein